jgi:LacI family transcriptional regulator/LacI family fructose operon transcriptional repressor
MQDVARAAGVHQTTVSRALRNDPRIPEATRERITRIAESLGYRPDPLVSALIAMRRSRHPPRYPVSLGFVAYTSTHYRRYAPHQYTYEAHLAGARAAAERQGYQVELFPMNSPGMTPRRLDEILSTRNIPGLIIGSLPEGRGGFSLSWERFCTVVIEYTFTHAALDRVVHDSYDGMRRIMQQCRAAGLRRVGLMLTAMGHERTERLNGAAYWIEQKSDRFFQPVPPLFLPLWDPQAVTVWHRQHRLEVVVTSNALLPGLLAWCEQRGLRPGVDLRVVNVNAALDGPVAGVYQDPFTIGATAARMVIEKIGRNDRGIPTVRQTILTQGRWVEPGEPASAHGRNASHGGVAGD